MNIGFLGPAACFIAAGYIECDSGSAVACIVMAVGLSGISWAGWSVNHLDLAPPFAGMYNFVDFIIIKFSLVVFIV